MGRREGGGMCWRTLMEANTQEEIGFIVGSAQVCGQALSPPPGNVCCMTAVIK